MVPTISKSLPRDEDVTRSKFIDPWKVSDDVVQRTTEIPLPYMSRMLSNMGKINKICDLLLEYFKKTDFHKYLLCIMTALVKHEPPRTVEALTIIAELKGTTKKNL